MKRTIELFVIAVAQASALLLPSTVSAQPCLDNAALFFVNGVNNTIPQAEISKLVLQNAIAARLAPTCLKEPVVRLAYNSSAGPIRDVFEAITQLTRDVADDDIDLLGHVFRYRTAIEIFGRKVVVVGHSQGNLYANKAFEVLLRSIGSGLPGKFAVVSVATPANEVAGGGNYVTLEEDRVDNIIPNALDANTTNGFTCFDLLGCHAFVESYLLGPVSGPRIIECILAASQTDGSTCTFDFAVDSLSVEGNAQFFLDGFDDQSLTTLPTSALTCLQDSVKSESGGFLNLTSADGANTLSPGFLVDHCQLGVSVPNAAWRLKDGFGDSLINASFRADTPQPRQGYGLQLTTLGANEVVNVQVAGNGTTASISAQIFGQAGAPVNRNLAGATRLFLRLVFQDSTNRVRAFFRLDTDANFTELAVPGTGTVMVARPEAIASVFGAVQVPPP